MLQGSETGSEPTVSRTPKPGSIGRVTPYEAALEQLPSTYAQLLRLSDAGVSDAEICRQLDIEPEGLGPLLDIATRKLRKRLTDA